MISKQFFQIVLFWTHCRTGKSIGIINVFDQMTGRLSVGAVGYRAAVFLPPGPEMAGSIPGLANTLFNGASWRPRYFDLERVLILQPISCTQTHLILLFFMGDIKVFSLFKDDLHAVLISHV